MLKQSETEAGFSSTNSLPLVLAMVPILWMAMMAAVATAIPITCRTTPSFVATAFVDSNNYNNKDDMRMPVFIFTDSFDGLVSSRAQAVDTRNHE
jgi:hypothetical protein